MILVALLLSIVPYADELVLVDRFDLVELNHFHDGEAKLVFEQYVFYDWKPAKGRHQVEAWQLHKPGKQTLRRMLPGCELRWSDDDGTARRVIAPTFRETWTQADPELIDRDHWPVQNRRGLLKRPGPPNRSILAR